MHSVNETLPARAGGELVTESLLRGMSEVVAEAGARARAMFHAGVRSWKKLRDSVVCDADLAVDALLRERLSHLAPEHGWFSEETVDAPERLASPTLWIVDPIDGTRAFIAGDADWCVSIALVANGRPVAAALHVPMSDELFVAGRGRGTTRNGAPVAVGRPATLAGARIAGPKPMLEEIARHENAIVRAPRIRSLALRLTRVATGELEAAVASADSNDWDIAAADLLLQEAGGILSGLDGRAPVYNTREASHGRLAAAATSLHPALLRALNGTRRNPPS
jgi:myo-inositol-1(or 4)-monophosphatase